MDWFQSNPHSGFLTAREEIARDAHKWGRQTFASNYARGGIAAVMFAPTKEAAMRSAKTKTLKAGSAEHVRNLEFIQSQYPDDLNIGKSLSKAKTGVARGRMKMGMAVGSGLLRGGFVALPAFTTPGGAVEKGRAVGAGVAAAVGWDVGAFGGMAAGSALGATIGSAILPGIGTGIGFALGKGIGYLAGGFLGSELGHSAFSGAVGVTDRMVDTERARRRVNWKNDQTAFMTQSAHTMRQQSLQAMNRGMMNARSMLGREGVMLHQ